MSISRYAMNQVRNKSITEYKTCENESHNMSNMKKSLMEILDTVSLSSALIHSLYSDRCL